MTVRYLLVILAALVPCFWQKRIQAADLGSHVYNAWLTQLVAAGQAEGLTVVSQTTNILFDWLLAAALGVFGWSLGEKMAAAAAVAVFVSGAFAWVFAMTGKSCWWIAPSLLMLAYGWVFHMGFFNFYLGLGLAFWALALVWREDSPRRWAGAALLLIAAQFAHTLPIAWVVAMLGFHKVALRLKPQLLPLLTLAGLVGVLAVRYGLMTFRNGHWQFPIIPFIPADQIWVFGAKYFAVLVALSAGWFFLVVRLAAKESWTGLSRDPQAHLTVLSIVAVFLVPMGFDWGHYTAPLNLIPERLTLPVGILLLGLLGRAEPERWQIGWLGLVAAVFFAFLWVDTAALNRAEDRLETIVRTLPKGARVIFPADDPGIRTFAVIHLIERPCIGRVYHYANYEPPSQMFRVRTVADNRIVEHDPKRLEQLHEGGYQVRPENLPFYQIRVCGEGIETLCAEELEAGALTAVKQNVPGIVPLLW